MDTLILIKEHFFKKTGIIIKLLNSFMIDINSEMYLYLSRKLEDKDEGKYYSVRKPVAGEIVVVFYLFTSLHSK